MAGSGRYSGGAGVAESLICRNGNEGNRDEPPWDGVSCGGFLRGGLCVRFMVLLMW